MTKCYKDDNELPYRWRYISPFNTLQGCHRFRNDTTIKAKPMARRKKKAPIYICGCTIFLAQILLIRPWPKAQPTINICRGWVKELNLSEPIRSNAWTVLLQKMKTQEWISPV